MPHTALREQNRPGSQIPGVVQTGLLAFSLLLGAAPSDAQPAVRQVLVLQSFDRGNLVGRPVHRRTSVSNWTSAPSNP